jgi:hypothetical protein
VVGLVDSNVDRLNTVADRLAVERRYSDYRVMLKEAAVDVVAVCTPPHLHAEIGLAVLDVGKHLFMEKPLALSLPDADRLVKREPIYKPAPYVPGTHYVSAAVAEMPAAIRYYLTHDAERDRIVDAAYRLVTREMTATASVARVLSLIGAHGRFGADVGNASPRGTSPSPYTEARS